MIGVLYGVLNLDQKPFRASELAPIGSALSQLWLDGHHTWAESSCGLGQQGNFSTADSSKETPILKLQNLVIAADARIDNREELLRVFGVSANLHHSTPDSWLILQAYLQWGQRAAEHLLGDFCFAIRDIRRQVLFLCRDPFGTKTFFFHQSPRQFVFSSVLDGVLAWPGIARRLNEQALASALIVVPIQGFSQTIYDEILVLPPGHQAEIKDGRTTVTRYWNPANIAEVRFRKDEEYVEAFRDLFSKAVACRLRSARPVAALLSGGLDSGAVASEAAVQMRSKGQRLAAYTSVPVGAAKLVTRAREFGDERALAAATASFNGNIDSVYVDASDLTPLSAIHRSVDIYRHPHFAAANSHWILAIYQQMQVQDFGTVLTGQYGNATLSWSGNPSRLFRELLLTGQWKKYCQEFGALRSEYSLRLASAMKSYLVAPLFPWQIQARIKDLAAGPEPWQANSAINPRFARALNLRKAVSLSGIFAKTMHNPGFRNFLIHDGLYSMNTLGATLSASFGLDRRDPTADKRLIEFCFGIPESQYLHNGQQRLLVRRAMAGKLPEEVLWNRNFGLQAADIIWRVRQSAHEIKAALETAARSESANEYLDVPRMRAIFEMALQQESVKIRRDTCNILLQGLATAYFLDNFLD